MENILLCLGFVAFIFCIHHFSKNKGKYDNFLTKNLLTKYHIGMISRAEISESIDNETC